MKLARAAQVARNTASVFGLLINAKRSQNNTPFRPPKPVLLYDLLVICLYSLNTVCNETHSFVQRNIVQRNACFCIASNEISLSFSSERRRLSLITGRGLARAHTYNWPIDAQQYIIKWRLQACFIRRFFIRCSYPIANIQRYFQRRFCIRVSYDLLTSVCASKLLLAQSHIFPFCLFSVSPGDEFTLKPLKGL